MWASLKKIPEYDLAFITWMIWLFTFVIRNREKKSCDWSDEKHSCNKAILDLQRFCKGESSDKGRVDKLDGYPV